MDDPGFQRSRILTIGLVRTVTLRAALVLIAGLILALAESAAQAQTPLRIVGDQTNPPYEFQDTQGRPRGILVDWWNLWSQKTGRPIEYILAPQDRIRSMVLSGQADLIGAVQTFAGDQDSELTYTTPLFESSVYVFSYASVGRLNTLDQIAPYRVGCVKDGSAAQVFSRRAPEQPTVIYPVRGAMLRDAVKGRIRVMAGEEKKLLWALGEAGLVGHYRQAEQPLGMVQFRAAVIPSRMELKAELDRGIPSVTNRDVKTMLRRWSGMSGGHRIPWPMVSMGILILGGVTIAFLFWLWNEQLRRQVARATADLTEKQNKILESEAQLRAGEQRYRLLFGEAKKAEELYRSLLASSADAILLTDLSGRPVYANPSFTETFGFSVQDLIDHPSAFTSPELVVQTQEVVHAAVADGLPRRGLEARRRTRDGRAVVVNWSVSRYSDHEGRPVGLLVILRDITASKRAQEDLIQSEQRQRTILDAAPDPFVVYDLDGYCQYVNPAFTRVFGWTLEEVRGRRIDYVPPETAEETRRHIQEIIEGRSFYGFETRRYTKSGSVIDVNMSAAIFQDAGGRIVGSIINIQDISGRKRMEEDLRAARSNLQNVIDSMPSALVGVDRYFAVTWWNRAAGRLAGLEHPWTLGRPVTDVFPALEGFMDHFPARTGADSEDRTRRLTLIVDGETRRLDVMLFSLAGSSPAGAVIRIDDVTGRVRIEEIMVQTEKMMSVGGMAAGMAHEINNPLGGIIQGAQNILRRLDPGWEPNRAAAREMGFDFDVVRAYLERRSILRFLDGIVQSGRRAARIVANMLEFSRAGDSGLVPCHMANLLDKSIELAVNDYDLKKKYDFRRITIEREYASGLPKVACDPTRMEQVLFNLLKNAAQAMAELPDEPGRIVLRTRFEPPWVRLEVEDNGPGIPETIRKRVFEPFFTTKPTGSGTGLGLSVSYFIVTETHKGTMSVESAPGHGTRFIIQLPAAKPEE